MTASANRFFTSPHQDIPDDWCGMIVPYRSTAGIGTVFGQVVAKFGKNIAVRHRDTLLTYNDLHRKSDCFASYLSDAGVGPGDLVGIAPDKSVELMVALLGILKAGAAYVPLDPAYPLDRLAFMATDTGIATLIGEFPELSECCPDLVSIGWDKVAESVAGKRLPEVTSSVPAYVMYTSGSTGEPKGTVIPHRAILRLVLAPDFVELGPQEKILQYAPIAFDASTLEIWGALLTGGELVLMPDDDPSLRALGRAIEDYGITTMWLTSGLFHAMADDRPEDLGRLRQLLTGGDVVSPTRAAKLLKAFPDLRLINGYGPTENTTFTCCHTLNLNEIESGKPLPIGRPIANTSVYILDDTLQPVTVGESGELCTGGDGLAIGYWNRPELTAEKFVAAPWDSDTILYRTGDLARFNSDGVVEFLGRIDQQVKIRGFRIELDEIEESLQVFDSISKATVIAHAPVDGAEKILIAFYVADAAIDRQRLTDHLNDRLPSYMVPAIFHRVNQIPLTTNGKVDRNELLNLATSSSADSSDDHLPADEIRRTVTDAFAEVIGQQSVPADVNFFDLGVSSLHVARVHEKVQTALDKEFPITDFFQFTTIEKLSQHIAGEDSVSEDSTRSGHAQSGFIAVVGMSGKFPGAPDVDTFWDNLCQGKEMISHFSEEELDYSNANAAGADPDSLYVRSRGIIEGSDLFDARHFGIPPKEAESLDPQHRVLLEVAQEALESAGCDPDRFDGKIGFFAGSSQNSYLLNNLLGDRAFTQQLAAGYPVSNFSVMFGNDKDFLPTRVAYKLNLKGQAIAIQCACSTSLVAIAEACKNLQSSHCDMALAGGISLTFPQKRDYLYTPDGMASRDGHCRTFDKDATGTVFGEGAGLVALKRLEDAERDGDRIFGVIRGFALNNDGADKAGFAAPSINGQASAIREAHAAAGVDAESITYIEAHGTGTPLGDPIEIAGLKQAFSSSTDKRGFCAIGTGKTNVGHLDIAAGVTGFIKTVLSLYHKKLPPLLHFKEANPKIDFDNSPFYPVTELTEWTADEGPRRAGISAFGVGGTNVHMVIEEAQMPSSTEESDLPQIYPVSGTSKDAVTAGIERLGAFASKNESANAADMAATLQLGRRQFPYRSWVTADPTMAALSVTCSERSKQRVLKSDKQLRNVCVLFPGQGSQHPGMARDVYRTFPVFRQVMDQCADTLKDSIGEDLRALIYPEAENCTTAAARLKNTSLAQPAIFAVEVALMRQWLHWGIVPSCLVGHSIGEFAAACIADVLSLEDALQLIALRGRLMADLPGGAMLSVRLCEQQALGYLEGTELDLAAINGATSCVVAGSHEAAADFAKRLEADDVVVKTLHTSHAFHSRMMDSIVPVFEQAVSKVPLHAPSMRILSTVTNEWMNDSTATDPHYWASHLRQPVRFLGAAEQLWNMHDTQLLEVGPGRTLATLAGQNPDRKSKQVALATLPHPSSNDRSDLYMLNTLGEMWARGLSVDWAQLHSGRTVHKTAAPTYAFQRKRFWIEPTNKETPPSLQQPAPDQSSFPSYLFPVQQATPPANPLSTESTPMMNNDQTQPQGGVGRRDRLEVELKYVLSELSGIESEEMDSHASFLELGFDSLLLTQAGKELKDHFGVIVTLRQLIDEFTNIDSMTSHLDECVEPTKFQTPAAAPNSPIEQHQSQAPSPAQSHPGAPPTMSPEQWAQMQTAAQSPAGFPGNPDMNPWMQPQPQMMHPMHPMLWAQMQMQAAQMAWGMMPQQWAQAPMPMAPSAPSTDPQTAQKQAVTSTDRVARTAPQSDTSEASTPKETSVKCSSAPVIDRTAVGSGLSGTQRRFIDDLMTRYTARTAKSKQLTQEYRQWHADPRTASGFNREWKEMVYQIITIRSKGSRLLDIDGNEYIDILNGFGPGFLGHSPDFIVDALRQQLDQGFEVGPQCLLALEAAKLFCEVTGNERASFVNTGSEAVQAAIRLSRTVTGRDKIVTFARDYHGNFDEVLVRGANRGTNLKTLPVAPGIPRGAVGNMIVLPYGTEESLEIIRELADTLAAVIVEPVQSRRPEFQPREFIREVRDITRKSGSLFVFDEVVTGFRSGPRGAQELYGVDADLATYGKVVGGGMPLGVVAGKADYMDTFDGGMWQFGDESFPEKPVTFFAGTFVRHPLAMASLKAMLQFFKDQSPQFWSSVNAKGNKLAKSVDQFFVEEELPIRMPNFGSLMFVRMGEEEKYGNLMFYNLRSKGVFMLEGFPSYVTAAHDDADLEYVIDAFKQSANEMREAGFFKTAAPLNAGSGECLVGPMPVLSLEREGSDRSSSPEALLANQSGKKSLAQLRVSTTEPQREIYLASRLSDACSCAFNESATLKLDGRLDIDKLKQAFAAVQQRHDCLRSTFTDDGSIMLVHEQLDVPFQEIDLTDDSEALDGILSDDASSVFDLENGPLLRAKLIKLGCNSHAFVITGHHIVLDGWSFNVIAEELSALYSSEFRGENSSLPIAKQFEEYALEATFGAKGKAHEEAKRFWIDQFRELPESISLPLDRAYPTDRTYRGGTVSHRVDKETYIAIKQIGAKNGCTLHATLGAVFKALMHRLTGQEDVVVGIPTAGQNDSENTEHLVGHCVHFLPLRSRCDGQDTFMDFLQSTRKTILNATDHRSFTYGELIQNLEIERDSRRMPLLEVAFNVERMDYFGEWEGLQCRFDSNGKAFVHYTMFMNIVESAEGLRIDVDYNRDVLDATTIQRWVTMFEQLIHGIIADASTPVNRLPLMDAAGLEQVTVEFNSHDCGPAPEECVHVLFEQQVALTPDREALVFKDGSFTYRTLNEKAEKYANSLAAKGIGRGDLVAVYSDRCPDLIAALIGIMKVGGAYVPIDPSYPVERIEFMLNDTDAPAIVTQRSLVGNLSANASRGKLILYLDQSIADAPVRPTKIELDKEDTAYVIYTSGSTGSPKGTVIPHRGITRLVRNTDYAEFGVEHTFLMAAPVSFDASTFEIWGPLLNGGRLAVLPAGTPSLKGIGDAVRDFNVTTLWLTAELFQLMVEERLEDLTGIKQLLAGGDVLPKEQVSKALSALGDGARLINGYGPTESTTFTTCHSIKVADLERSSIPIGRPIPHTQTYILDADLQPVPVGVRGQLYIGGEGLATGYLHLPEMTNERFIANPFSSDPASRLYASGDICRWLADGKIEFAGRGDSQVKIRGFRIEPGEVEAIIGAIPAVSRAVVVVAGEGAGDKRLIAYVCPADGMQLTDKSLRQHTADHLPSYMTPSSFVILKKFPVTANGKIDYRALPAVDVVDDLVAEKVEPTTDTQHRLVALWQDVLEIDRIGVTDDFFAIGGHSLKGLQLFTRIQDTFGVSLPLATLFKAPTIEKLAKLVSDDEIEPLTIAVAVNTDTVAVLRESGKKTPIFNLHGGDGGVLFYKDFCDLLEPDRPFYAIEAPMLLDNSRLLPEESVEATASLYLKQIKAVRPAGPYIIGGFSFGGVVAYEIAQQLRIAGDEVELLVLFDTPNPARENEFRNSLWGRVAANWQQEDEPGVLQKIKGLGGRLGAGMVSKVQHHAQLNATRRAVETSDLLDQSTRLIHIRECHGALLKEYCPTRYDGTMLLTRAGVIPDGFSYNREMGWDGLVDDLQIIDIPGDHENIFYEPHTAELAQKFQEALNQLDEGAFLPTLSSSSRS
ncbi:MAG: amino acid adenylation domain-containing protein [Verrucomicrobiales bacterium]|jgi:amino acid adenylation domain-containing protein